MLISCPLTTKWNLTTPTNEIIVICTNMSDAYNVHPYLKPQIASLILNTLTNNHLYENLSESLLRFNLT